jgi:hypothetical protein
MAATFIFKLGTLDLSSYLRVNPDDKMDPYGEPWLNPAFTETPFADGQPLISTTVSNREQHWPLFLKDATKLKDQLHTLIQSIQVAAGQKPLVVEWRDDGASNSTFFDVAFLRFEPEFNFRRSQAGYGAGVLHIWVSGYGSTGTVRVVATAAGTGIFLSVPLASVAGDAPALMDSTIRAGAVLPSLGRIVGLAPIPHPSYAALVPAASLLEAQTGATLVGASGAQGSQYLALPVSPTGGASGIACKVPLGNPTIMGGDNRVLAVVNSGIEGGVGIAAFDPYGNAMGPTAVASMSAGWGLVDLGVCRLPTVGFPTAPQMAIVAGGIWASGQAGPGLNASPGLSINEVIVLPDKNLSLVLESRSAGSYLSRDSWSDSGNYLVNRVDAYGHAWTPALNHAHSNTGEGEATGGAPYSAVGKVQYRFNGQVGTTLAMDADRVADVLSDAMTIEAGPWFATPGGHLEEVRLFKDVRASQFVQARLSATGFLALEAATGGAAGNVLASLSATLSAGVQYTMALQVQGPKAFVTFARLDGGPVFVGLLGGSAAFASIGVASNAAVAGAGAPALAITSPSVAAGNAYGPRLYAPWLVTPVGAANLAAYDAYRFDGPNFDVYRTASSGVFSGQKLMAVQRGAFPKAAPSTSSVAIVCAPFDQGAANDVVSATISLKERFFYAR